MARSEWSHKRTIPNGPINDPFGNGPKNLPFATGPINLPFENGPVHGPVEIPFGVFR